ncbi:hypothetical protein C8J57DRAFT_1226171 [Mycena rebaudengoi]|nr:hypothetical protein C8J57DRAFT_1226171 [Mycena rebaudengoi]
MAWQTERVWQRSAHLGARSIPHTSSCSPIGTRNDAERCALHGGTRKTRTGGGTTRQDRSRKDQNGNDRMEWQGLKTRRSERRGTASAPAAIAPPHTQHPHALDTLALLAFLRAHPALECVALVRDEGVPARSKCPSLGPPSQGREATQAVIVSCATPARARHARAPRVPARAPGAGVVALVRDEGVPARSKCPSLGHLSRGREATLVAHSSGAFVRRYSYCIWFGGFPRTHSAMVAFVQSLFEYFTKAQSEGGKYLCSVGFLSSHSYEVHKAAVVMSKLTPIFVLHANELLGRRKSDGTEETAAHTCTSVNGA